MIFVTPVFVLFLQENGLSLGQVMILQTYYTLLALMLEIPTGIFADKWGRKTAIFYSTLFMAIGSTVYGFGRSFAVFFVAETFWAVAASLWSGTDAAFIYDTLRGLKRSQDYKKVYGTFNALNAVVFGIASIIGGIIATYSLRLTYQLTIIPVVIATMITLTFKEPRVYRPMDSTYWKHLSEALNLVSRNRRLKLIIIFSSLFSMVNMIAYYFFQPYFRSLGVSIAQLGTVYFVIWLSHAAGNKVAHRIDTVLGEKLGLFMILILAIVGYIVLGVSDKYVLIIPLVMISFAGGALLPIISDSINKLVKSYQRATVLSMNGFSEKLLFSAMAPFAGVLTNYWHLSTVLLVGGIILTGNLFILALLFHGNGRKVH